jgi:hypothetical protein
LRINIGKPFIGDWPKVILQTHKGIAANHWQTQFAYHSTEKRSEMGQEITALSRRIEVSQRALPIER